MKTRTPTTKALAELQRQLNELQAKITATPSEDVPSPEVQAARPGEYVEDGKDPATGRPTYRKRRWSRAEIVRAYPAVTFLPLISMPVNPHGLTKGGWQLIAGKETTVPSIVKDLYDNAVRAIEAQTAAYKGMSPEQERALFEAAQRERGQHFTSIKHVGFGWSESALRAHANGQIDPSHEPELGFPRADNAVRI